MIEDTTLCWDCGRKLERKKGFIAWLQNKYYCPYCDEHAI